MAHLVLLFRKPKADGGVLLTDPVSRSASYSRNPNGAASSVARPAIVRKRAATSLSFGDGGGGGAAISDSERSHTTTTPKEDLSPNNAEMAATKMQTIFVTSGSRNKARRSFAIHGI